MKKFTITVTLFVAAVLCVNDAKAQCSVGLFRQSTVIQQSAPLIDPCIGSSGLIAPQFGAFAVQPAFGSFGVGYGGIGGFNAFNSFGFNSGFGAFGRGEFRNRIGIRERGFGGRVGGVSFRGRSSGRIR